MVIQGVGQPFPETQLSVRKLHVVEWFPLDVAMGEGTMEKKKGLACVILSW